ncbi:hypothetical protein ABPG73_017037 [Tetrahymena malaccensis]
MIEIDKLKQNLSETDQFLIENYKKCSIHSNKQLIMVRIDDEQDENQLQCMLCAYRNQNQQYLPLELIIDSKNETIFKGWPVFDDKKIYQNVLEATQQVSYKEQNIQDVKIFFKELKAQVFNLIEQKENELLQIVEQKSNSSSNILKVYNYLSQKERLKDIILNHHQDLESQDKLLKDLIRENKQNQETNRAKLEDVLNTQKLFKIDMTPYKEIQENLIGIINSINSNIKNSLNIQLLSEQVIQQSGEILVSNTNQLDVIEIKDLPNCKNFENMIMNFKEKNIGTGDITLISNTLSDCSQIKTLELQRVQQQKGELNEISNSLQNLNNIKELSLILKPNQINDQHLQRLEKAIEVHKIDNLLINLAQKYISTNQI